MLLTGITPALALVLHLSNAFQLLPPPLNSSSSSPGLILDLILDSKTIYIYNDFAPTRDKDSLDSIWPRADQFAEVFRQDISSVTRSEWTLTPIDKLCKNDRGIVLGAFRGDKTDIAYENDEPTEEGYEIEYQPGNGTIYIGGTGARGLFWGTRTLLQQLLFAVDEPLSAGKIVDAPAYATRGFMLDAGRKWYALDFLKDLCTYASFFKMSEFHYHSNDNYPLNRGHNETWNKVYSQYSIRPEDPSLEGMVQRVFQTLSPADFEDFQQHCASRGVTVIVEIEAPGHALSITKWKPEMALAKKDLLNLSYPETIPFVKSIWADVLPRIHASEVHIGADEYDPTLADDYINFVNEMANWVRTNYGKKIRIWGTHEPSENVTISKDIIFQHWQYGQSDPVQLETDGYDYINSDDKWAYMSLKNDHTPINPAPYAQFFNETRVTHFAGKEAVQWNPQFVNSVNFTMQVPANSRHNKGAILAAWNDNGPNASTQLEAYYAIRRGIALVGARAWGGSRGPLLDLDDLDNTIDFLSPRCPGANLDRVLTHTDPESDAALISWTNIDSTNTSVDLGHGSKGMNYTLVLTATGPFNLTSLDASLSLTASSQSGSHLVFIADGIIYPLQKTTYKDSSIFPNEVGVSPGRIWANPPNNQTESTHQIVELSPSLENPVNITITTDVVRGARCWVNDEFVGRFEVLVFGGRNTWQSWSQMAFVAPLDQIEGELTSLEIFDAIIEPGKLGLKV
ncbi:hypothetical protein LTR84_008497 [Exophiala bonariae]|uniref:beta-N-acetylhexosaminidase n=1 Tax=Exophiala bonariae TaxID=1690606 RepID=A0AAV9N0M2_9EURO|nr:hypothetical protein LTR84_008497 [Exophiala bonariae]